MFFVLSGALSPVPRVSFFGMGDELGTVVMGVLSFGAVLLSSMLFAERSRLRKVLFAFISSALILSILPFLRLHIQDFWGGTVTPAGDQNDLAIFMGGLFLLSLLFHYFYPEKRSIRALSYVGLFFSFLLLLAIGTPVIWVALSLVLCFFVQLVVRDMAQVIRVTQGIRSWWAVYAQAFRRAPRLLLLALLLAIALSFGVGDKALGTASLSQRTQSITQLEQGAATQLSFLETLTTAKQALTDSPLFGAGPNRFGETFLRYRDVVMSVTPVWDKVYDVGFGYIPTLFVTMGLTGAALILYFIFALLFVSRKLSSVLALPRDDAMSLVAFYGLATFFFFFIIFASPGISVFALAFIFIGAFVGALRGVGLVREARSLPSQKSTHAILSSLMVLQTIALVVLFVILSRQVFAYAHYYRSEVAITRGDLSSARYELAKAYSAFPSDTYARSISVLALIDLNSELHDTNRASATSSRAFTAARIASAYADEAIRLDPTNAKNYVQRGAVYETLALLGVNDALSKSRDMYTLALLHDPTSPDIMYYLGRVELSAHNDQFAIEWFEKALRIRPNHQAALAALVALRLKSNDSVAAFALLNAAVAYDPKDGHSAFILGKLYYDKYMFDRAAKLFASALRIDPLSTDARFYLAAAAFRGGEKDFALGQFRLLLQSNIDHALLNHIISVIEQGNDPFVEDIYGTTNN
jgi:tetratricopeptide (TPR) repeat protein